MNGLPQISRLFLIQLREIGTNLKCPEALIKFGSNNFHVVIVNTYLNNIYEIGPFTTFSEFTHR